MKMFELVNASPALRRLATQELNIKTAYDISRVIKSLDPQLEFYDHKYAEMLSKYCDQDGDKWIPKTSGDHTALQAERAELLDLEVDISEIKKAIIPATEKLTLSVVDLMALENFIVIKFEEENLYEKG